MKKLVISKIQKILIEISLLSVGKSIPIGIYEKKIPTAILKMYKNCQKENS